MMDMFKELSTEVKDSIEKMKEKENGEIKVEANEGLEHVKMKASKDNSVVIHFTTIKELDTCNNQTWHKTESI